MNSERVGMTSRLSAGHVLDALARADDVAHMVEVGAEAAVGAGDHGVGIAEMDGEGARSGSGWSAPGCAPSAR